MGFYVRTIKIVWKVKALGLPHWNWHAFSHVRNHFLRIRAWSLLLFTSGREKTKIIPDSLRKTELT
jgi:hypothetical protein